MKTYTIAEVAVVINDNGEVGDGVDPAQLMEVVMRNLKRFSGIITAVLLLLNLMFLSYLTANSSDQFKVYRMTVNEYLNLYMKAAALEHSVHLDSTRLLFVGIRAGAGEADVVMRVIWEEGGNLSVQAMITEALIAHLEGKMKSMYMFNGWSANPV